MTYITKGTLVLMFAALVAGIVSGQEKPDPGRRLAELEAGFNEAMKASRQAEMKKAEAAREAMEKAVREGKPVPGMRAMRMGPPRELAAEHMALYEAAAADYAGTDDAIPFLNQVIVLGGMAEAKDSVAKACATLMMTHIKSPKLSDSIRPISYTSRWVGKDQVEEMLRKIEVANPDPDTKAQAILARVNGALERLPVDDEGYLAARAEALRAADLAKDPAFKRQVQGTIDGREKLVRGKVAPDIAGVDLDGVAFKLSDYKGKVILLDFWGDW